jgi:cation diffusion facilitator CzcD-associated flavoprotein CzcO
MATPTVIIVGAGPAGLAAGACLRMRGVGATLLEAGDAPATTWRRLYDRLHLHTVRALSNLPGYPMPASYGRYPSRQQVVDYLLNYAKHFDLDIRTDCRVSHAQRDGDGWVLTTPSGEQRADVLISATGVFSQPRPVTFAGQADYTGQLLLAHEYQRADSFAGQRVLVVGAGNSGAEIAVDLAEHGVATIISIRVGANVVPRELLGLPIQRWAHIIFATPRPITSVVAPVLLRRSATRQSRAGVPKPPGALLDRPGIPVIGLDLLEHTAAGDIRVVGDIARFTATGVQFADGSEGAFDSVILATGYQPALAYLGDAVPLNERGFPAIQGVQVPGIPNLYFVGMNYDLRGTLFNIAHEAPVVAKLIAG